MYYNNNETVKRLKSRMMFIGICLLIAMTVLIFIEEFVAVAVLAGIFLVGALTVAILNFQYLRIIEEKNKLIFRYFSIFSVNRTYQSIEIPIEHLRKVEVFKFFFGLKWDIRITVRTRQGIADYPLVSISAIPFSQRHKVLEQLKKLVPGKEMS
jgi:hypothetical protein